MRKLLYVAGLALLGGAAPAAADFGEAGVPASSIWYFHADFDEMRRTGSGKSLYAWLDEEVFGDIRNEVGIDLDREADTVTAFAGDETGTVIVVDGSISQQTRDKLLALMALGKQLDTHKTAAGSYYFFVGDGKTRRVGDGDVEWHVDSFEDGMYVSFAIEDRLLATSSQDQMEALLANKGRVPPASKPSGTLFVLTAEKNFMQAGMKPRELGGAVDWDSNMLANAEQVALMVADVAGKIAFEAKLVAEEAEMAQSLASIARGLIGLQMFNDELDPEITDLLRSTRVDVRDRELSISIAMDPSLVLSVLD